MGRKVLFVIVQFGLALFVVPTNAFAQLKCGDAGAPPCISGILPIIENIIKILTPAAAIAFFIMLLIGGFKFVNSGGDPKAVASARATLTYAIIGVILVIAVYLILTVIKSVTNVDVLNVNIPS